MGQTRWLQIAGLAVLLAAAPAGRADTVAFDFTTASGFHTFGGTSFTAGYTFTVNSPILVTQLGVWDQTPATPLARDHPVGIWDAAGTLLGSETVLANSPLTGMFRFVALTSPFELAVGQEYTIGAFYPNMGIDGGSDQPLRDFPVDLIQAPDVAFGTNRFIFDNTGLARPTFSTMHPGDFGPNFQFQAVPAPATLPLFALGGLAVLALVSPRRRRY